MQAKSGKIPAGHGCLFHPNPYTEFFGQNQYSAWGVFAELPCPRNSVVHSFTILVTIKCRLATFSSVPSLVNFTSNTYFFLATAGNFPRNLKMLSVVYFPAACVVLDPLEEIFPSSQTVQSARSSRSLRGQSFQDSGESSAVVIIHAICSVGSGFSTSTISQYQLV